MLPNDYFVHRSGWYTGIGSRATPPDILQQMTRVAIALAELGWVVRSGGAAGADTAFEQGSPIAGQRIFLPWAGFNGRRGGIPLDTLDRAVIKQAGDLASRHHPAWNRLRPPVQRLMTRNVFQVLGEDLNTPSTFVLCWAPNPTVVEDRVVSVDGGTGLAVRLAASWRIPVYHMGLPEHQQRISAFLSSRSQTAVPPSCDRAGLVHRADAGSRDARPRTPA